MRKTKPRTNNNFKFRTRRLRRIGKQADVALEHHQQKSGNVNQHPIKRNRSTNKQAEWIDG